MKKNRLIINLVSNIFAFVLQLGISFFITPIITEKVSNAAYGFVGLANNYISYISIFSVVINSMASRFITIEIMKKNMEKANKYYSSVLIINIAVSFIIAILSAVIIYYLEYFINIPIELIGDVKITFILASINLIISLLNTAYSVAAFAKNRLDLESGTKIIANILKTIILIILFMLFKPNVYFIMLSTVLYSVICIVLNKIITSKLIPELKFSIKNYDKNCIKTLIKSGLWNAINNLGKILLTGLDLLIANLFISENAMGLIAISKTVPTSIENLLGTIANVFSPKIIMLYSKNKIRELVNYIKFSMKIIATLMIVPVAGFLIFGIEFFSLWLPSKGIDEIQLIQKLSILALLPYVVSLSNFVLFSVDTATNKLKRPVLATLFISVLSIITTLLFLKFTNYGIYAVAGVSSIFWGIKVFFFNTINAAKNLRLKWYTFFPQYLKNIFTFIIVFLVYNILKLFVIINSWTELLMFAILFGIIGYLIVFVILFDKNEKNIIISYLKKFVSKKKMRK